MKTSFPACKQNGAKYASLDEIMTAVGREPHGSWLAGTNRMWHGGIHLTEVTAPGSLLKPDMSDAVIPLQCIAEGEVVACRLNQDYLKSTYLDHSVQFSSTFVLVKSVCKPDPEKENSWLEFYSLYIGLAPLSAFQKCKCMKAKKKVSRRVAGNYESSQGSESPPLAPAPEKEKLAKDSRILVLKETTFMNGSEAQPFGLAQQLDQDGNVIGKTFWVTLKPEYMAEDGEEYAHLPAWMKQVLAKGTFDAVVKPDAGLKINAGDPIGFLGEDIVPVGMGKTSSSAYAHIEVLSADSRMPAFLDNPGAVTSGQKYIRIKPDSLLYTNSGDTFTQTSTKVGIDIHSILPADECNPKESGGKKYYQISEQSWLSQDEVEECNQYDLIKLGFSALVQETTSDMSMSLKEEWVTEAFETYSEQVIPERGIKQQQLADFYKGMMGKLDSDQNGELSGLELYNAVHHPDLGIRDIAARMMVKHESEWFGGSSDPKWAKFFEAYDPLRKDFTKKWLDSMEWMSQVEPFTSGGAVWHMHPVVFLSALDDYEDEMDLKWLKVEKGQVTFDAEGNDVTGNRNFSRQIHWPGNELSGVTLGRGYDMGGRSKSSIHDDMVSSGIDSGKADEISNAAGLKGSTAMEFVLANRDVIGEITRMQQNKLFNLIYPAYVTRAEGNYATKTAGVPDALPWGSLEQKIQDILVDFLYQGFSGERPMRSGMKNSRQEMISYIENNATISSYENGRHRANYLREE